MNTQAADAWLILSDADAVETKVMVVLDKILRDRSLQEALMHRLTNTSTFYNAVTSMSMNGPMADSVNKAIRHTLESAEVMIQEDFRTYGPPRFAVRFQLPQGETFVIQPEVMR